MSDEQNNQSVKDILEDIKKAISGKNGNAKQEEEDILHLEEEYMEDHDEYEEHEEDEGEDEDMHDNYQNGEQNNRSNSHSYNLQEESAPYLHSTNGHTTNGDCFPTGNDNQLVFKKNMEEIKALFRETQCELQKHRQQQQNKPNLTVEELVISLLKPELSEWLNKHLYKLVKEVVEKEIKNIIK